MRPGRPESPDAWRGDIHRRSHLARRLAGGSAAGLGTRLGKAALSLTAAGLLARDLPPFAFGVYLLGQPIALFGSAIAVLGLENVLIRELAGHVARGEYGAVRVTLRRARILVVLGSATVAAVVLFGRGALLRQLFDEPALAAAAGGLVVWVCLEAFSRMQVSALRGQHRLAAAAVLDGFVQAAVFLAAVIWMRSTGTVDLSGVFAAAALSSGTSAAAGAWLLSPFRRPGTGGPAAAGTGNASSVGALWERSWPLLGATALGFLITRGDLWLVGIVATSETAALYGSALKLMFVLALPMHVLNRTLSSTLAEMQARGCPGELEFLLRGTATVAAVATGVPVLGLLLFGEEVLVFLFGPYYAAAAPVLAILALARMTVAATGPCGAMLMMAGHERLQLAVSTASAASLLLGALWAGTRYGMVGVALVSFSTTILNNLVTVVLVRRRVGVWSHAYLSPFGVREGLTRMARMARGHAS